MVGALLTLSYSVPRICLIIVSNSFLTILIHMLNHFIVLLIMFKSSWGLFMIQKPILSLFAVDIIDILSFSIIIMFCLRLPKNALTTQYQYVHQESNLKILARQYSKIFAIAFLSYTIIFRQLFPFVWLTIYLYNIILPILYITGLITLKVTNFDRFCSHNMTSKL